jgi:hypothetical protein
MRAPRICDTCGELRDDTAELRKNNDPPRVECVRCYGSDPWEVFEKDPMDYVKERAERALAMQLDAAREVAR